MKKLFNILVLTLFVMSIYSQNNVYQHNRTTYNTGVTGESASQSAVYGYSSGVDGVNGSSVTGNGVHGGTSSGLALYGSATSGNGLYTISNSGVSAILVGNYRNASDVLQTKMYNGSAYILKFRVDTAGNAYKQNNSGAASDTFCTQAYARAHGGGGMVYPGAGIPNSTGSAWGTSYTTSGSGTVVALATSPSFTTPTLGVASATSINKVAVTTPATSATLTIADGATLQQTGAYTLNLTTSAATTPTFPAGTYTLSAFWTPETATTTRTANTTFTVAGDKTTLYSRKMIIKWTESSTVRCAMVVSSSYSSPNTTVTIIGDVMTSIDAGSLKYTFEEPRVINFAIAGTIGATGTDVAQAYYADEAYRVIGADVYTGTAGTTNSTTFDINKGGTTMFTTKPTIASTATAGISFTADNNTSLALSDKVTIDIDAVQTTAAVDGYVKLFVFPTKYLSLP